MQHEKKLVFRDFLSQLLTSFQVLNEKFIKDFDYKLTPVEDDYKNLVLRGDGYFEYKKEVIFANIKAVTKLLNSKFIEMDSEILVKHWEYLLNEGSTEVARDGQHPTKPAHEKFSELMMAKIKGTK